MIPLRLPPPASNLFRDPQDVHSSFSVCGFCDQEVRDLISPYECGHQSCTSCWQRLSQGRRSGGDCPSCFTPSPFPIDHHVLDERSRVFYLDTPTQNDLNEYDCEPPPPMRLDGGYGTSNEGGRHSPPGGPVSERVCAVNRRSLQHLRIIQRNLVYVIGLSPNVVSSENELRSPQFFGQYGDIAKVVMNHHHSVGQEDPRHGNASAYVTFVYKSDAWSAIRAVDGFWLDGRHIRASFGTTKYCNSFLRNIPCNNADCLYLHEPGDVRDRFTKEEIQAGLARHGSSFAFRAEFNAGGHVGQPSGTGIRCSNPVLPPPMDWLEPPSDSPPPMPFLSSSLPTYSNHYDSGPSMGMGMSSMGGGGGMGGVPRMLPPAYRFRSSPQMSHPLQHGPMQQQHNQSPYSQSSGGPSSMGSSMGMGGGMSSMNMNMRGGMDSMNMRGGMDGMNMSMNNNMSNNGGMSGGMSSGSSRGIMIRGASSFMSAGGSNHGSDNNLSGSLGGGIGGVGGSLLPPQGPRKHRAMSLDAIAIKPRPMSLDAMAAIALDSSGHSPPNDLLSGLSAIWSKPTDGVASSPVSVAATSVLTSPTSSSLPSSVENTMNANSNMYANSGGGGGIIGPNSQQQFNSPYLTSSSSSPSLTVMGHPTLSRTGSKPNGMTHLPPSPRQLHHQQQMQLLQHHHPPPSSAPYYNSPRGAYTPRSYNDSVFDYETGGRQLPPPHPARAMSPQGYAVSPHSRCTNPNCCPQDRMDGGMQSQHAPNDYLRDDMSQGRGGGMGMMSQQPPQNLVYRDSYRGDEMNSSGGRFVGSAAQMDRLYRGVGPQQYKPSLSLPMNSSSAPPTPSFGSTSGYSTTSSGLIGNTGASGLGYEYAPFSSPTDIPLVN